VIVRVPAKPSAASRVRAEIDASAKFGDASLVLSEKDRTKEWAEEDAALLTKGV
jgi:hypothetical protein